jgi:hypothetical protein
LKLNYSPRVNPTGSEVCPGTHIEKVQNYPQPVKWGYSFFRATPVIIDTFATFKTDMIKVVLVFSISTFSLTKIAREGN